MNKYLLIFLLFIISGAHAFATHVSGRITDKDGIPISNARVIFTNTETGHRFEKSSNSDGYYNIDFTTSIPEMPENRLELYNYPNPFNSQTVLSFYINESGPAELAVYNMSGQRVHVIESRHFTQGQHQIVWDTRTAQGRVGQGVYICMLRTKSSQQTVRMVIMGGENVAAPAAEYRELLQTRTADSKSTSSIYNAVVIYTRNQTSGREFKDHLATGIDLSYTTTKDFVIDRTVWTPFSTVGDYLGIYNGTDYTPFFIKGINLGTAVPGSQPGQLAISAVQYANWFRMIADAGFNTVRIYTLHYPRFYEEFARYNRENPRKPLYLLQGVWLDEVEETPYWDGSYDLHALTIAFDNDIKDMIDCLHGNKTIGFRPGYAFGIFTTDVSQWVLGMVIGREIHPYEVKETNLSKPANTTYSGTHLSISNASPSEVWATERLDRLIKYERDKYGSNRPVSFSSWPTLDPITHPSEEPFGGYGEDDEQIDLNKMKLVNASGGFFASYHAYPYYPHFMNWDYDDERNPELYDDYGFNNYLGYLRQLRSHYTNFPLLITEFGVPSSYGNARNSLSGMNHGGMTEKQQGNSNMRMLRNIYDANCGGGVMFSWMDEWFKRTWITNPLVNEKRHLWHNISSPENNFGLVRFDPNPHYYNQRTTTNISSGKVSKVDMWHDFTFLNMEATLKTPLSSGDTLWFALDTYKPGVGESTLPNGQKLIRNRAEFLLRITPDSANLYVTKAYNLLGLVFKLCEATSFQTKTTNGEPWQLFQLQYGQFLWWKPNFPYIQDLGKLNINFGNEPLASHQTVQIRNDRIYIRIPWGFLHFSNPASSEVIDDNESIELCKRNYVCGMQHLKTKKTDGINVTFISNGVVAELKMYRWDNWNVNSQEMLNPNMFIEVEKASLSIVRDGLKNTPFTPKNK